MSGAPEYPQADSLASSQAGGGSAPLASPAGGRDPTVARRGGAAPILRPAGRGKMIVLAALTLACYAGANSFWLYLSTGEWCRLRLESFLADFTNPVTLPDLFERTLNVLTHPWMIAVGGMVLGIVIFVPIMVAVLYRLAVALPLVAVVLVAGHAPAMAVALAIGCVLADRTRLRRTAPFLAAVVGAMPLALYLYLFSAAGASSVAVLPIQRWAQKSPYLVAMATAVAAFAIILGLARLTRYRPGIIWPVMAILLAATACLFAWKIGRDELEYQIIAQPLAAGDAIFESVDRRTWIATRQEQGITSLTLPQKAATVLEERKAELQNQCGRFLRRFPARPRAAAVAWVQAQCQSLQLDRPALAQGWVKSTAAFVAPIPNEEDPSAARRMEMRTEALGLARGAWEGLRQAYGDSPQAALASWRVAELDLRGLASGAAEEANRFAPRSEDANQVVHRAEQRLRSAEAVLSALLDDSRRQGGAGGGEEIFTAGAPLPPREYYEQALHKVRRLLWLMDRNEALSNPRSAEAIGAMLDVNGYGLGHDAYAQRLYDLAGRYEDTPMAMNLKLAVALTQTDRQRRADQLVLIAEQDKDHDAAIEADYELGQLVLQEPPVRGRPDIKGPGEYFARIVHDGPYNPWKALSAERLGLLAIARPPPTSRAAPLE